MTKPSVYRSGTSRLNRRRFLKSSTATATTLFLSAPAFLRGKGLNEKLNIAGVGVGGQGGQDINQLQSENIVALCDVDSNHAAGMFKQCPKREQRKHRCPV